MARKTFSMPLTVVSIFVAASLTLGTLAGEESNLCSGIDDEEFDHSTLLQLPLQQQPRQSIKDVGNLCDEEFDQSTLLQLPRQQQPKMTAGIKDSGALAGQHQRQSTARTWVLSGEVGGILAEFYYYTSTPPTAGNFDVSERTPNLTQVDPSINFPHKNLLGKRNNFCIRFTGGLRIATPGNYTLSLISDDGSILLLDSEKVVDNGGWHGMQKKSASVELAAGDHPLEVQYVQGTSGAGIILRYSGPDTGDAEWVVPSSALVTPAGVQLPATTAATRLPSIGEVGGLLAEFFYDSPTSTVSIFDGDLSEQEPDVSRVDTAINYPKVSQAWTGLTTYKNFCAKWSGGLRIEEPGTYTLRIESDDGSVLLLDGTKVVDNDGYHNMRAKTSDVELVAGDHPIEVRYFSSTDGAGMNFMYAGPDTFGELIVVPATALVAPEGVQPPAPGGGPPPRAGGLLHRRSDMRTDFVVPGTDRPTSHNECNFNTPDGRLFFCGEMSRYVRYFKFESLTYTANGMPIFNDSTWSMWPERLYIPTPNEATGCVSDWKKPFEVLADGSHFYSFFATNVKKRVQINVTVANPMTPQAEIVNLVQGSAESWSTDLPKYHYFTADGKMVVGDGGYSALPESGEPCSLDGWHPIRPLTSAYADADGLNLPARYPFARWRLYRPGGEPWLDEAGSAFGRYFWIDLDGRNLWYGRSGGWQVMGEDTYGMEYTIDGPMNLWGRTGVRFMSSTLWNFESERTAAHRFPGELHTSGVGSGCTYQLQMSKAHHVLPVFDAKSQFYTEVELVSVWKSPHWDIFFLPMVNAAYDGAILPDMSRHFLNGRRVGNTAMQWDMNDLPAGKPHGQGAHVWVKGDGGVFVDLSSATDVMGVTSSTRAFTAQLSFRSYSYSNNHRPLLVHPDISLWHKGSMLTWTFKGESITGGGFVTHSKWHHVALVFDGVDQTVTTFNNGFEVTTVATGVTSFQLDKNFPVIFGHNVTENLNKAVGHRGLIDNIRFMHHARAQKAICGDAAGSNCNDAVSHHATTTQFSLSMQIKECTAATMHTLGCSSAIHRVCANLDAKKGQEANISNDRLLALTPPGPPVSMAGVPVSIGDETVAVACSPNTNHLSVPVDWWIMEKYESHCNHMSNHSSLALYCNLAAHGFCKDAFTDIDSDSATGIIFEADARAWVSCFAADDVLSEDIATLSACSSDLTGIDCQLEAAALCTAHDGGVPQALVDGTLLVHCFNAPPALGLHSFTL